MNRKIVVVAVLLTILGLASFYLVAAICTCETSEYTCRGSCYCRGYHCQDGLYCNCTCFDRNGNELCTCEDKCSLSGGGGDPDPTHPPWEI